jgi:hypothetical protein
MKFTVYYIDDQSHPQSIEANSAQMAAWQFLQQRPRSDTSQITVDSHPSVPWRGAETTHYRACDLLAQPAPADEARPDLALRVKAAREVEFIVSGSLDSLRIFATQLLRSIEGFPTRNDQIPTKHIYSVLVIPGDGARAEHYLSFEADADVQQYWARRRSLPGLWREYGRCLVLLILAVLTRIGLWTVARWIF